MNQPASNTRNLGGRPSISEDGDTVRITVTIPRIMVKELDRQAEILGTTRAALARSIIDNHIWQGYSNRDEPTGVKAVTDFNGLPWVREDREWRCLADDVDRSIGMLRWSRLQSKRGGLKIISLEEAHAIARADRAAEEHII